MAANILLQGDIPGPDPWPIAAAAAVLVAIVLAMAMVWIILRLRAQAEGLRRVVDELAAGELSARTDAGVQGGGPLSPLSGLPAAVNQMADAFSERLAQQAQLEETLQHAYDAARARAAELGTELEQRGEQLDRLRESQNRYRAVIGQTADGFFLANADNKRVLEFNRAFRQLLGYSSSEMRSLTLYDFMPGERREVDATFEQAVEASEGDGAGGGISSDTPFVERQYRRKDGSLTEVEVGASRLFYRGREVLCVVVHDISARKKSEKELLEKNALLHESVRSERAAHEQLKKAQSQLVQSEKLAGLGQMVAGVAHEINNPLAFVSNNVAVFRRDVKAIVELIVAYQKTNPVVAQHAPELSKELEELRDRLDLDYTVPNLDDLMARCVEGLRRIQQIVTDLRDFARLDEADLHEVDLNAGIASTINIISNYAKKKNVRIELDLQPLPQLACWPAKINQVVMNLVSNAIDASPPGAAVTVHSQPIAASGNGAAAVTFDVTDRGCGIDPNIRSRIFDPFFTTKPQGEGTGLGLSISYGIIRDHGGSIDVQSAPGQGSKFIVKLPLHPPKNPNAAEPPERHPVKLAR